MVIMCWLRFEAVEKLFPQYSQTTPIRMEIIKNVSNGIRKTYRSDLVLKLMIALPDKNRNWLHLTLQIACLKLCLVTTNFALNSTP